MNTLKSVIKKLLPTSLLRRFISWMARIFYFKFQHLAFQTVFKGEVLDWEPDVVQCNDWQTLSLGAELKQRLGCYLIFDSHELETHRNPPLSRSRKRWMTNYERKYLTHCDLITTVCEPIAAYLAKEYSLEMPTVVYNAPIHDPEQLPLAFERWGRKPKDIDLRSEIGVDGQGFLVVVVGNVTINRGIETLIEAMALLPSHVNLAILGKVNEDFKEMILDKLKHSGVSNRVHFVEPVNPVCVVDYIKSADLGVIPLIPATLSYELALPNKLFECAFASLPIVASDTYEMKRIIELHKLGTTCPSGDPFALAKMIGKFVNPGKIDRMHYENSPFIEAMRFEKAAAPVLEAIAAAPRRS